VKETAYQLGFRSRPHFSTWFRRQQGSAPRASQRQISGWGIPCFVAKKRHDVHKRCVRLSRFVSRLDEHDEAPLFFPSVKHIFLTSRRKLAYRLL
jgi:AraC-like DNA-binding protein